MDNDFGIKISKPGYDVETCGDDDLILNSKYPMLKINSRGSGSLVFTVADSSKSATIPHGLDYAPLFVVYSEYYDPTTFTKASGYLKLSFAEYYGLQQYGIYTASTDDTNLTIDITFNVNVPNAATLNYYYLIYADEY